MPFLAVVSSGDIIVASCTYILCVVLIVVLGHRYRSATQHRPGHHWTDRLRLGELSRLSIIAGFVYFAYPTLFGLSEAPTLAYLAYTDETSIGTPFQLLFVIAFPVTIFSPIAGRAVLIPPIQACLMVGYSFLSLTAYLGVTVASMWPGFDVFLWLLIVAYIAEQITAAVSGSPPRDDLTREEPLIADAVRLVSLIPIVLIYGYGLGRQLAIV
jgi:hypothetical protein